MFVVCLLKIISFISTVNLSTMMFSPIYNFGLILISGAAAAHRRGGVPGTSITAVYGYHSRVERMATRGQRRPLDFASFWGTISESINCGDVLPRIHK